MSRRSKNSPLQRWECQKGWMKQYGINPKQEVSEKPAQDRRVPTENREMLVKETV